MQKALNAAKVNFRGIFLQLNRSRQRTSVNLKFGIIPRSDRIPKKKRLSPLLFILTDRNIYYRGLGTSMPIGYTELEAIRARVIFRREVIERAVGVKHYRAVTRRERDLDFAEKELFFDIERELLFLVDLTFERERASAYLDFLDRRGRVFFLRVEINVVVKLS